MEVLPLREQTVERCATCGGIWAEWFDGPLADIARGVRDRSAISEAAGGTSACPACRRPLEAEPIEGTDGVVLRCGECAGAFVPRRSFEALLSTRPEGRADDGGRVARLLAVLRRLLDWDGDR
jgi:hypothetical protein